MSERNDIDTLEGFLAEYAPEEFDRPIIEVEVPDPTQTENKTPFIVVRDGAGRVMILNPILGGPNCDHLCVDAHGFLDDQSAAIGVLGMDGRTGKLMGRQTLDTHARTSHKWPATGLAALIIGEQAWVEKPEVDPDHVPQDSPRERVAALSADLREAFDGDSNDDEHDIAVDLLDAIDALLAEDDA